MRCPVCQNVDLLMSERQGVEIDYCPQCRGVWLDRGELDKILERSSSASQSLEKEVRHAPKEAYRSYEKPHYHTKKKESFLSELFDF
ncbi:MAG: zf-TFIIB domain-containing protein [Sulfurospirillum sp.]|nr:zf-TFIIB domain-containing protein [Sulfurospirillum sp.]